MTTQTINTPWGDLLKAELTEWLGMLKEGALLAGDFAKEQTPLLLQEILKYNFWLNIATIAGGLIWLIATFFFCKWATKKMQDAYTEEGYVVGIIISALGSIFSIVAIVCSTVEALQIYLAPRLYLLEYFGNLLK